MGGVWGQQSRRNIVPFRETLSPGLFPPFVFSTLLKSDI